MLLSMITLALTRASRAATAGSPSTWILAGGTWDDSGVWDDAETWVD